MRFNIRSRIIPFIYFTWIHAHNTVNGREREQERCIVYTNLTRWATKRKCWKPNNNVDNKFAHFAHSHRWQHLPLLLFHLLCAYQFTKTSVKTLNKNQKTFLVAILRINGKSCSNLALFDFEEKKKWFKMNWLNRPIGVLLRTVICGLHFEYVQKCTFFWPTVNYLNNQRYSEKFGCYALDGHNNEQCMVDTWNLWNRLRTQLLASEFLWFWTGSTMFKI